MVSAAPSVVGVRSGGPASGVAAMTKRAPAASQHRPGERPSSWTTAVTRSLAGAAVLAGAHVVRRQEDADGEPHEVRRQPEPDHRPARRPSRTAEVHQPDHARRRHGEGEHPSRSPAAPPRRGRAPATSAPAAPGRRPPRSPGSTSGSARRAGVVDVDVGQEQGGDPLAGPGPAVARAGGSGRPRRSRRRPGRGAARASRGSASSTAAGSPARCRAIQGRDSRKPDSTKNTATPTSSRDSAVP